MSRDEAMAAVISDAIRARLAQDEDPTEVERVAIGVGAALGTAVDDAPLRSVARSGPEDGGIGDGQATSGSRDSSAGSVAGPEAAR